jgi:hypothetical protein
MLKCVSEEMNCRESTTTPPPYCYFLNYSSTYTMKLLTSIPLFASLLVPSHSFTPTTTSSSTQPKIQCRAVVDGNNRRDFMEKITSQAFSAFGIVSISTIGSVSTVPLPALAEVAKGDSLPDGAAQFKRLVNLKSDIPVSIILIYFVIHFFQ